MQIREAGNGEAMHALSALTPPAFGKKVLGRVRTAVTTQRLRAAQRKPTTPPIPIVAAAVALRVGRLHERLSTTDVMRCSTLP